MKTCAGAGVSLAPYDSYFNEMGQALKNGYTSIANRNPEAERFVRRTTCDSRGRFTFRNLPVGKWLVGTSVRWGVPSANGIIPQGGWVFGSATTTLGHSPRVFLTQ